MKYLTAVLKNEDVQKYILENEDSAFEYLKENLNINNIYESVIANMPKFITVNSDLTSIYEAIKEYTSNYVMTILQEIDLASRENPTIKKGIAAAGLLAVGAGIYAFWDQISSLWSQPEKIISATNNADPKILEAAAKAVNAAERNIPKDMVEVVKTAVVDKVVTPGNMQNVKIAVIEKVQKTIANTVDEPEANRIQEIWDNAKEMSVDPRYYIPMMCLVLVGIIWKFKFKRS
ncbi:MAG: hypothetical protein IPH62_19635 [Ignavibacteriae bacterium]|nr:hypothetical protein [Ignavibacteriota bacterium]